MRIRYCIVTLNQFSWVVDRHLPSVDESLVDGVHLFCSEVQDQSYNGMKFADPAEVKEAEAQLSRFKDWKVSSATNNFGVANAWNFFVKEAEKDGYDAVILANDDIFLYPEVLQNFVDTMKSSEFTSFAGSNMFSFFGIHVSLFNKVGDFDENFWPAYYEDNDYFYRMKLLGIESTHVTGASYFHAGSATLGKFDLMRKMMHHHNFSKNTEYYKEKWGGMPHEEKFTRPFDGDQNVGNLKGKLTRSVINGIEPLIAED
jgi:GT2 family glycosyltransferase